MKGSGAVSQQQPALPNPAGDGRGATGVPGPLCQLALSFDGAPRTPTCPRVPFQTRLHLNAFSPGRPCLSCSPCRRRPATRAQILQPLQAAVPHPPLRTCPLGSAGGLCPAAGGGGLFTKGQFLGPTDSYSETKDLYCGSSPLPRGQVGDPGRATKYALAGNVVLSETGDVLGGRKDLWA